MIQIKHKKMGDYDKMLGEIKDYFKGYGDMCIPIQNNNSLVKIHNLINDNIDPPNDDEDDIVMYYYGLYYRQKLNHNDMMKYHTMASDKGNTYAMTNIADYFACVERSYGGNIDIIEKYYLMAIEKGDCRAMRGLANYYAKISNNNSYGYGSYDYDDYDDTKSYYGEIKKYFLMAIEKGDTEAMVNLGDYYGNCLRYEKMIKYYLMAIENNDKRGLEHLCKFYKRYHIENNDIITLSIKHNMYSVFCSKHARACLANHNFTKEDLDILSNRTLDELEDAPEIIKIIHRMIKTPIDNMKLHFDYTVHGKGYDEAKDDFLNIVTNRS